MIQYKMIIWRGNVSRGGGVIVREWVGWNRRGRPGNVAVLRSTKLGKRPCVGGCVCAGRREGGGASGREFDATAPTSTLRRLPPTAFRSIFTRQHATLERVWANPQRAGAELTGNIGRDQRDSRNRVDFRYAPACSVEQQGTRGLKGRNSGEGVTASAPGAADNPQRLRARPRCPELRC